MKLTEHFSLSEFTRSSKADELGIDNTQLSDYEVKSLQELCTSVLEPLREQFGLPISISSGYRCYALNKAVSGASDSEHTKGRAADIKIKGIDDLLVFNFIRDNLEFNQLILEFYGTSNSWVHVSYHKGNNKKEVLKANKKLGKTVYTRV